MNDLRRIKQKWMALAPQQWWGDSIDVRFYLITQLRRLHGQTVLDVGCSVGMILSEIDSSNRKYGFDIHYGILTKAQKLNPDAHFAACSALDYFPYQPDSFDVVIMSHVIPYYDYRVPFSLLPKHAQIANVFAEIHRILKPKGKLLLTTPNGEHFCYQQAEKIRFAELQHVLARFRQVRIYGWNPLPPFVFFLPHGWQQRIPPQYHRYLFLPSPVLARIPGIMNVLRYVMTKKGLLKTAKAFYVECEK